MAVLSIAAALQIASSCAPNVAPQTLLSVAHTESRMSEFAIGDNTTRQAYQPGSLAEAVAIATRLIAAGHSVDLGLAQINSSAGHLQRRSLPISAAFDPCAAFRVGGEVLAECYGRTSGADEQVRLRAAAGCYNTGRVDRGAGYIARVWKSAEIVVPAIEVTVSAPSVRDPVMMQALPPPSAAWDIYAQAKANRSQGIVAYSANRPMPAMPSIEAPVQLQATSSQRIANAR